MWQVDMTLAKTLTNNGTATGYPLEEVRRTHRHHLHSVTHSRQQGSATHEWAWAAAWAVSARPCITAGISPVGPQESTDGPQEVALCSLTVLPSSEWVLRLLTAFFFFLVGFVFFVQLWLWQYILGLPNHTEMYSCTFP